MTKDLAKKECKPCNKETKALKGDALKNLKGELGQEWRVVNEHHLEKEYSFENFKEALDFTNRVGEIAEKENHHPDVYLAWGKVGLKLWTHNIEGLSENDFIFAAKADEAKGSEGEQVRKAA